MKHCTNKKCNKEFEPRKGLINYCSLECRNSRGPRTTEFKKIVSAKLKGRLVSEERRDKQRGSNNWNWKGESKFIIKNCKICNEEFKTRSNSGGRKTCSRICSIKASTERKYRNGSRKTIYYNGVILESSWELEIAKLLDSKSIKWIRPKSVKWFDGTKDRLYYPDFYLIDYDLYLDPKNPYCMELDFKKMNEVKKNINIVYGDLNLIKETINDI